MRLRSFTAKSLQEARDKVRDALGDDAIIANTRDLGSDGFQIVCAIDDEDEDNKDEQSKAKNPNNADGEQKADSDKTSPDGAQDDADDADDAQDPSQDSKRNSTEDFAANASQNSDENSGKSSHKNSNENSDESSDENASVAASRAPQLSRVRHRIHQALRWHELDAALIKRLLSKTSLDNVDESRQDNEETIAALAASIERNKRPLTLEKIVAPGHLIMLVGPPGSGKTSFAARLAILAMRLDISPALVAADRLRVGATEQLQEYAHQIGAEFCVPTADRMAHLAQIAKMMKQKMFVIIDTPGINPFSREDFMVLSRLVSPNQAQKLLVLPSTMGHRQASRIAAAFQPMRLSGIIATNLDVEPRVGGVISATQQLFLPLITASKRPNVAEPLEDLNGEWLARWIMETPPIDALDKPLPKEEAEQEEEQATARPTNDQVSADVDKLVVVASGKGGVGKTWFSITLAQALAKRGRKVLLFDGDLGMANIDIQLGLTPTVDLAAVLKAKSPLNKAILTYKDGGFDVIAGRSGSGSLAMLTPESVKNILVELAEISANYDHVIIDLGAGIDRSVRIFIQNVPLVMLLTNEEPTSIADTYAFLKTLFSMRSDANVRLVINNAKNARSGAQTFETLSEATRQFLFIQAEMAGVIVNDHAILDAIRHQTPLMTRSSIAPASKQVMEIAKKLDKGSFSHRMSE